MFLPATLAGFVHRTLPEGTWNSRKMRQRRGVNFAVDGTMIVLLEWNSRNSIKHHFLYSALMNPLCSMRFIMVASLIKLGSVSFAFGYS